MPVIDKNGLVISPETPQAVLSNGVDPNEAFALYGNAAIVGIEFPLYVDGRGSSLVLRIRRLGFAGKLRAIGPLIPDQFPNLIACGFDEVEISDEQLRRQPISQWLEAVASQNLSYQHTRKTNISIIQARMAKNNAD